MLTRENRWRVGTIVSHAMAESLGLFGLVLRMIGGGLTEAAPFYAGAIVLLLVWTPRGEFAREV